MPISIPLKMPSKGQIEKAKRCCIWETPEGWNVWDPKVDSNHIVDPDFQCDCIGFSRNLFCSHVLAMKLFLAIEINQTFADTLSKIGIDIES